MPRCSQIRPLLHLLLSLPKVVCHRKRLCPTHFLLTNPCVAPARWLCTQLLLVFALSVSCLSTGRVPIDCNFFRYCLVSRCIAMRIYPLGWVWVQDRVAEQRRGEPEQLEALVILDFQTLVSASRLHLPARAFWVGYTYASVLSSYMAVDAVTTCPLSPGTCICPPACLPSTLRNKSTA